MSAHATFLQRRPLPEARALLLAGVEPAGDEEIEAENANGRIAAATVVAVHPAPHYRASAMDGIAVRTADTWAAADAPVLLRALPASSPAPAAGDPCCVPVDTGSLLPQWADAVVRIEDVVAQGDGYRIKSVVPPGNDVRSAGEDIAAETVLLPAGARIRPWDIGAMLATGITIVRVRLRPRVAILATGGEVVEPSGGSQAPSNAAQTAPVQAAAPGQVIEYNSRVIAALVEEWGGSAHRLGIVADDEASLARAIADAAARFDVVCVIAGSSAGRKDFTIAALASQGEVFVHGVDIAPGRPVALARVRRASRDSDGEARDADANPGTGGDSIRTTPAIAVPGYPVSAVVVCERLLRPLVAALLGSAEPPAELLRARVVRKIPSRLGMEEFRRVCLARRSGGEYVVAPLSSGAGSISTISTAHGWLRIAPTAEGIDAGADVDVELIVARDDVDAAFVLAGQPCATSAALEAKLREDNPRARVAHLRRGANDALAAVATGEAHGAIVPAEVGNAAGPGFALRSLAGSGLVLATLHVVA